MNSKFLLLLSLPALALAVHSCGGKGGGDDIPEPYVFGVSTDYDGKAVAGKSVTVNGRNFSTVASENKVIFGVGEDAVAYRVNESAEDHLVFTAPTIAASQVRLSVSVKGKSSNSIVLEYTEDPGDTPEETWSDTPTVDLPGATTVTVRPGVEWTTFHGKWEGDVRNINIVRTTLDEHNKLGLYFNYDSTYPGGYTPELASGQDARDLDKKCIYLDALIGTNGPMACCHFVRVDGDIKHGVTEQDEWVTNCALVIDGDVVDIVKVKNNVAASRLINQTVGCAGPLLVWDGKVQGYKSGWLAADKDAWLTTTHPRTALGLSRDGKTVVQVAVDGRWTNSSFNERAVGMSCELLGKLMKELGCYKAVNFDGGGGTAMWVYGYGNSRNIVNKVCENRWNWNGTTLRPTGCAVYIKSDLK